MMNITRHIFMLNIRRNKAVFDLDGNTTRGSLKSRTATKLVREWIDLHVSELQKNWDLAKAGKEINKIEPLK